MNYKFDGWLGDDLLETFPCFIVSDRLAQEIEAAGLTGATFDAVEVSKSEQFNDLYPGIDLPNFLWLKVIGEPQKDDFGVAADYRLVVSGRAMAILKKARIDNADVEPC